MNLGKKERMKKKWSGDGERWDEETKGRKNSGLSFIAMTPFTSMTKS